MSGRHLIRSSALLLVCLFSRRVSAQTTTSLLPDATVLPSRVLRVRGLVSWTRYDELLGDGGSPQNIGSRLSVDSLGSAQIPAFSPAENAIRDASGMSNFRLNAGQLSAVADSRVVTAPLILEYGLSSRLTFGVVIPLVETRTSLAAGLNSKPGLANVGVNGTAVAAANSAFLQSMTSAASALQAKLTQCQTTPATCGLTSAQQATAQSLIQSTGTLSSALAAVYGVTGTTLNQGLIPLDSSSIQSVISARVAALQSQYSDLLGADDPISGSLSGAHGPAANAQLGAILTALGHDTLQSIDRSSIGDITVGATYQFVNSFPDSGADQSTGLHYRLAGNASYRIGSGQPANRNRFFDIGTGYGQPGVNAGLAADVQLIGNLSASAIGSYTAQFGSVPINRLPNAANFAFPLDVPVPGTYSAGNVLSLSFVPRYRFSGSFGLTGRYTMVRVAADTYTAASGSTAATAGIGLSAATAQQLGIGITYATIVGPDRGPGRIPFEVSFNHLETISASGGPTPKTFVDQIELRVYFGGHH